MHASASGTPRVRLDYAVAVDATSLEEAGTIDDPRSVRLLIAAQVGPVRLIDNSAAVDGVDDVPAFPDTTDQVGLLERIG